MTRPLLLAALSAVTIGAASLLAPAAWAQDTTTGDATAAPAGDSASSGNAASSDGAAADASAVTIPDMAEGSPDAPITVVEYGSFTCPHCAAFHAEVYPQFKADYVDTGKVQFIFREVYFDRPGLWASMIARCGGQMRFFGLHDMIYDQQREWIGDQQPATIAENLRNLGRVAGLDDATLEACLSDQAQAEALVAWYEHNAEADGIDSTPTFLINGEKHSGEMPYEDFRALVDEQLAAVAQ